MGDVDARQSPAGGHTQSDLCVAPRAASRTRDSGHTRAVPTQRHGAVRGGIAWVMVNLGILFENSRRIKTVLKQLLNGLESGTPTHRSRRDVHMFAVIQAE